MRSGAMLTNWRFVCNANAATEAGHRLMFLRMPGVNRQGQAHIVSTAIVSPGSGKGGREVEATPWFRTWFSIDPQPASISPTINISIFICAFLVDCGRTNSHPAIKNDSSAILRRWAVSKIDRPPTSPRNPQRDYTHCMSERRV